MSTYPVFGNSSLNRGTVDVAATLSDDRSVLYLTAINRHPRRPAAVDWRLGALEPGGEVRITTLAGPEPWARNTAEGPRTVSLATARATWPEASRRPLPAASVTGYAIPLKR